MPVSDDADGDAAARAVPAQTARSVSRTITVMRVTTRCRLFHSLCRPLMRIPLYHSSGAATCGGALVRARDGSRGRGRRQQRLRRPRRACPYCHGQTRIASGAREDAAGAQAGVHVIAPTRSGRARRPARRRREETGSSVRRASEARILTRRRRGIDPIAEGYRITSSRAFRRPAYRRPFRRRPLRACRR